MKLEQQVCSLELAKRLKELGVKQESYAYWCWNNGTDVFPGKTDAIVLLNKGGRHVDSPTYCSAFTVAELGEMLREEEFELPTYLSSTKEWVAVCETTLIGGADTEADARAKMLIYLLENKLITL